APRAEEPAVKRAAQAAIFEPAEGEVGAAVRAVAIEHAQLALLVTKQDEVLAHQLHRLDWAGTVELVDQRHWLPIAAQQLAGGSAGTDPGDEIILFCADHGGAPSRVETVGNMHCA